MAKRTNNEGDQYQGSESQDADNFGLPDIEYKPLETTPESHETTVQETSTYTYQQEKPSESSGGADSYSPESYEEETKSNAPMIIGLIIVLVVVVAGFLIYTYVYKPQAERAKREQIERENERKRKEQEARLAREREAEEERRRREAEAAANAKPAIGTIETLSARTKRYFVVISSSIDDDLVMDYAKKLSAKGVSTKIIPPYGKYNFYRLTVSDYDTFDEAQKSADAAKAEYGDALWVLKY